jgi:hypothetical protein
MKLLKIIAAVLLTAAPASAEIHVRLSIKAILGPFNEWPDNAGAGFGAESINLNSVAAVRDNIRLSNDILRDLGTGIRFILVGDTVQTVAGMSNPWFTADARCGDWDELRAAIHVNAASRTAWRWDESAINIYINDDASGCGGADIITAGANSYTTLLIHEVLHCLNLGHTHGDAGVWVDGDGFSDTLPDLLNSSVAQVNAQHAGQPQWLRDDLIFNIMSYHLPQNRLTWQQKRAVYEEINSDRSGEAAGRAIFTRQGGWVFPFNLGGPSWDLAYGDLSDAYDNSSSGNDTLVINSGTWDARTQGLPLVMNKAMTLTVLNGPVTIIRSTP